MEPTASGVLAKTPLAHLIVYCVEKKLRGALIFRPEGDGESANADVVTLVDGYPAKIRVADPIEHLGRILVEIGAIDDAAYNESLMAMARGEGLHGQILLKGGRIDATTLERGMRTQIARKLGHLFSRAPSTTYAYYDGQDFLGKYGGPELFPVDPLPTTWVGIRTNPSTPHVDATLERVAQSPLRVRDVAKLERFNLSRSELALVERMRETPSSVQQLASAELADARTTRLLLYALLLFKQIEVAPAPQVSRVSVAQPPTPSTSALQRKPSPVQPRGAGVARVKTLKVPTPVPANLLETGGGGGREGAPSGKAPSATSARRAEIQKRIAQIPNENYFQILGVTAESTMEDAKSAYFQLAKSWHPDRLPNELADLKADVAKVFTLMAEAYQTLTDQERRVRYLHLMKEGGGTPADQAEVARVMEAANAFAKADFFVQKGAFGEAEPFAQKAFELEPNDPDHVALWSWIQANKPERREAAKYDDLLGKLEHVISEAPKHERARFYRAMILKAAGRMGDAIRDFKEIVDNNPKHVDAVREVRLHTMRNDRDRKNKDDGTGSLLGKFMKRK